METVGLLLALLSLAGLGVGLVSLVFPVRLEFVIPSETDGTPLRAA